MKKIINGKVVDIKNIELFEKAFEGMVIGKIAASTLNDKLTVESSIINECISHYEVMYKSMPFPLYCIEENVKYATLGNFIKKCMKTPLNMWVDSALFICIDKKSNSALKIVGNTWGVVTVDCNKEDNTDIDNFKDNVGYEEYKWIMHRILERKGTGDFYKEFMPEFVSACGNQSMVIKWELTNMLNFGNVTNNVELKDDKIIDIDTLNEYTVDIFVSGTKQTGESEYVLDIFGKSGGLRLEKKYAKVYDFDIYEKVHRTDTTKNIISKIKKDNMIGIRNMFNSLCSIKMAEDKPEFDKYSGIISEGFLIYTINNRLFITKAYKQSTPKEIARNVEIYGFNRGLIYFIKKCNIGNGIKKEQIYSYSIRENINRLCKIQFTA